MITGIIILLIVLHWSFSFGMYIAAVSDIPISRFLVLMFFIKMMTSSLTTGGV
jgi:hypothetical protein|tara:strand:+ start:290 stop:448 length:159 start_codon:yes stop_codon:yes gene_type:complete